MLKIGSFLSVGDNSGAFNIKILHFIGKKTNKSTVGGVGSLVYGVVQDYDLNKKGIMLKKKDRVKSIIVNTKKKYSKYNGMFITFSHNVCLPLKITRFIVPIADNVHASIFYEIVFFKKYKVIIKSAQSLY